jgi:hypothetical protein
MWPDYSNSKQDDLLIQKTKSGYRLWSVSKHCVVGFSISRSVLEKRKEFLITASTGQ